MLTYMKEIKSFCPEFNKNHAFHWDFNNLSEFIANNLQPCITKLLDNCMRNAKTEKISSIFRFQLIYINI